MFGKIGRLFGKIRDSLGAFGIIVSLLGLAGIVLLAVLNNQYNTPASGYLTAVVYVCSVAFTAVILHFARRSIDENNDVEEGYDGNSLTEEILLKMDLPLLICRENGQMYWGNKAFREIKKIENVALREQPLTSVISYQPDVILNTEKYPDGVDDNTEERQYKVKAFRTSAGRNGQKSGNIVLVWYDHTDINNAYKLMTSQRALVCSIMVDNIEEIIQLNDVNYREIASAVDEKLNKWAQSFGGLLKEFQRDRYILIFDAGYLNDFAENKFDILERIREITVGDNQTPVTVSMGISDPGGSLETRMKSASDYLEVALQRGGDQVAVKMNDQILFFGGITKSTQKITKTRARVMAGGLSSVIRNSSNVLIMGHRNADYDCFGACIAAAKLAAFDGVPAKIVLRETDPNISKCLSRAKKLPYYSDLFIDSNTAQDLINSGTLLIIVDVNNFTQFESRELFDNCPKTVIIDHHRLAQKFSPENEPILNFIDPSASSTCEIFSEFLEELLPDESLTSDEADFIYAGIAVDTKKFTVNAGAKTFSAAVYLRKCGADPMRVNQTLFSTTPDEVMKIANFHNKMKVYRNFAAIAVNERTDLKPEDERYAAMAADALLALEGITASFTICLINNEIKIKARSNGSFNVQLVIERLGGGGHYDQAACSITGATLEQACTVLKESIDYVLSESANTSSEN